MTRSNSPKTIFDSSIMFSTKAIPLRALSRAPYQVTCPAARRLYATDHDQRTKEMLKTSSRLTWITTTAAIGAAALYYTTNSSPSADSPASPDPPKDNPSAAKATQPGHRHEAAYASDVPKPVEDRHGDSVSKHSIAAHKNEEKVREGKFSGKEFDNHVQTHSPGKPGGDFEKR
ncbi:chitin binding [Pyrenophora seminiperda CCB06]|uniref:Chitin binding n=1 Tax=Pyrenophora seminiperda CCB06 TaxID=1302712 RepID=A0A3M7M9A4_9PLEO|nr:chitin binding [Pyrenophora seminiperda CCB06]